MKELYITVQYAAQNRNSGSTYHYEFRQFITIATSNDEAIGIALRGSKENYPLSDNWYNHQVLACGMNDAISSYAQGTSDDHTKVSILRSIIETCKAEIERIERMQDAKEAE